MKLSGNDLVGMVGKGLVFSAGSCSRARSPQLSIRLDWNGYGRVIKGVDLWMVVRVGRRVSRTMISKTGGVVLFDILCGNRYIV